MRLIVFLKNVVGKTASTAASCALINAPSAIICFHSVVDGVVFAVIVSVSSVPLDIIYLWSNCGNSV